jgi:hypothetical protein
MKNFTKTFQSGSLGLYAFEHSDANHCINTPTSIRMLRSVYHGMAALVLIRDYSDRGHLRHFTLQN